MLISQGKIAADFCSHGVPVVPVHLRSDNGPEFIANALRAWLDHLKVKPLFIEPGSPWENGYVESFNVKMRDELLNPKIFYTLTEAQILIARWREEYNHFRPQSSLGYRFPDLSSLADVHGSAVRPNITFGTY